MTTRSIKGIAAAFVAALTAQDHVRGRAAVEFVDEPTPSLILAALEKVAARAHAVACVSVAHPDMTRAIARSRERGVPVRP